MATCLNVVVSTLSVPILHHANKKFHSPQIRPLSNYSSLSLSQPSLSAAAAAEIHFGCSVYLSSSRKRRLVVAGAGPPSTSTLIIALVFPLSLLLATIFTSIRIADKLDQQYLEELAINEAIMEEEEEEEEDGDVPLPADEEPALQKSRNRPKREA